MNKYFYISQAVFKPARQSKMTLSFWFTSLNHLNSLVTVIFQHVEFLQYWRENPRFMVPGQHSFLAISPEQLSSEIQRKSWFCIESHLTFWSFTCIIHRMQKFEWLFLKNAYQSFYDLDQRRLRMLNTDSLWEEIMKSLFRYILNHHLNMIIEICFKLQLNQ